ncbi:MAG: histidine phosphatase family protein [Burkholderiales bacterium]
MSFTRLVMVRHGETAWNAHGRIQGHIDIALNELGEAQAAAVGKRLAAEHFDAVYASDLQRAYRTACPAVVEVDRIVKDPRLRERHLGVLQGLTGAEASAGQPAAWQVFKSRNPGVPLEDGESLSDFYRRVIGFLTDMAGKHAGQRILAVTHGGVLDAAYRHASGMSLSALRDFPILNASINLLRHDDRGWHVESWGDISHLPQELTMDDT